MRGKNSGYEQLFRDQPVWKSIFAMAVPSLLTIVIMIFYNMADMFFIAQLGDTAKVASVSIISPVFNIIMAVFSVIYMIAYMVMAPSAAGLIFISSIDTPSNRMPQIFSSFT